jgi:hypothetical protein
MAVKLRLRHLYNIRQAGKWLDAIGSTQYARVSKHRSTPPCDDEITGLEICLRELPMPAPFFTDEHVATWEQRALGTIQFQFDALRKPGLTLELRWQRFGHIAGAYESLAMVAIARKTFGEVRGFLCKSMEMHFEQFEIQRAQEEPISAGYFQLVLLAYVTMDPAVIHKMLNYYHWDDGVPESVFLGKIIKSLAVGDTATAQVTLSQKRPRIEKMFSAYPDCLHAIANKDQAGLCDAIAIACKTWARRAARYEKGGPHAVCFLQGIGLVRLAEQVIGGKVSIAEEHIPPELLE